MRVGFLRPPLLLGFFLALVLASSACSNGGDDKSASSQPTAELTPKKMTFMAGFKAQANLPFVGVYVAQEKGFFKQQNLEVDIKHAQSGEHLQLMLAGDVHIATAAGALVLQRAEQGLPVVSLALIGQKGEQGYAALESSDIKTVKDWEGKTFGYKGSVAAEFYAVAKAANIDANKVKKVRVGFDPRILSEGQVDLLAVFLSNEPNQLARLGFKTRVFDPEDFGVKSPGLTYIASRIYMEKDPDAVQRFVKAALKGIDYAMANRDEALDIVMKYAPQEDREHQRFMMNTEMDRAVSDQTKKNGLGWQTKEQWQAFNDTLFEYKTINKSVDVSTVFTDKFVSNSYKDGKLIWP